MNAVLFFTGFSSLIMFFLFFVLPAIDQSASSKTTQRVTSPARINKKLGTAQQV